MTTPTPSAERGLLRRPPVRPSEGMDFGPALVRRGTEERLAPILMTALATALALLPIAVGGERSGHEIEHQL